MAFGICVATVIGVSIAGDEPPVDSVCAGSTGTDLIGTSGDGSEFSAIGLKNAIIGLARKARPFYVCEGDKPDVLWSRPAREDARPTKPSLQKLLLPVASKTL
jgi:hypothetical protein